MDKAAKIKKYETIARIIKTFRPDIKTGVQEIAAELYQADENRRIEQADRMKRGIRQGRDVQRILDFGR